MAGVVASTAVISQAYGICRAFDWRNDPPRHR
jgi:hypothetical protein